MVNYGFLQLIKGLGLGLLTLPKLGVCIRVWMDEKYIKFELMVNFGFKMLAFKFS
jgi:hypothetical protein